jgi:hypothetical protein
MRLRWNSFGVLHLVLVPLAGSKPLFLRSSEYAHLETKRKGAKVEILSSSSFRAMLDTTEGIKSTRYVFSRLLFCTATRMIALIRVTRIVAVTATSPHHFNAALRVPLVMIKMALESCCVEPPLSDLVAISFKSRCAGRKGYTPPCYRARSPCAAASSYLLSWASPLHSQPQPTSWRRPSASRYR